MINALVKEYLSLSDKMRKVINIVWGLQVRHGVKLWIR